MFQICRPTQADYQVLTRDPPPPIKKYWNYVLHYVLSPSLRYWKGTLRTSPPQVLELCIALLCHPCWVPGIDKDPPPPTPTSIMIVYCIMFFPTLPGQLTNVPQPCQVLPPCIGIMYCIRSDYHCLFRRNPTTQLSTECGYQLSTISQIGCIMFWNLHNIIHNT